MKTQITIINNKKCQIISSSEQLDKRIKFLLSYKQKGVEWTFAYGKGWNGITFLINKKGEFSFGLLEKVKNYLTSAAEEFIIEDRRILPTPSIEMDIAERLNTLNKIPRDYQI